ncbi:MAG: hypothetical protein JJE52_18640 [Acidimicrobiia bacterium]|nr:hypothetical protein [Acidimicrobiia bacterium]
MDQPNGVDDGIRPHLRGSVAADQRWFWSQRWQSMEREADADIEADRLGRHDDVDSLIDALDS